MSFVSLFHMLNFLVAQSSGESNKLLSETPRLETRSVREGQGIFGANAVLVQCRGFWC